MTDLSELSPESIPVRITLWRVVVPLRYSHSSAHGAHAQRDVILVEWHSRNGATGWGECPTFNSDGYVTETTDDAWSQLRDQLVPAALGGRLPHDRASAAAGALLDARLDSHLRSTGRSLVSHLGAHRHPLERTTVVAAVGASPREVVRRALDGLNRGASLVKVKIAPSADMSLLAPLCEAVGSERLAADANGSYTNAGELAKVDSLGLRYLEQPFSASIGWEDMADRTARLRTPVALDESIRSFADLDDAAGGSARIVSIKPARVGGTELAARLVGRARELGIGVFVGGMVELAVGRAGALAVASLPGVTLPTDLGPSDAYFAEDIADIGWLDAAGRLNAPVGPGIGCEPDPLRLERFASDRLEFV